MSSLEAIPKLSRLVLALSLVSAVQLVVMKSLCECVEVKIYLGLLSQEKEDKEWKRNQWDNKLC